MASLETGPVGKDALFDALARSVPAEDNEAYAEDAAEALGQTEEFALEETDEDEERDMLDDAAFQRFLEESDEDNEAEIANSFGFDSTSPEIFQRRRPGEIISTHRTTSEMTYALSDQQRVKELERLQHDFAAKNKAAEDARQTLNIEEQKLRALRKQAASWSESLQSAIHALKERRFDNGAQLMNECIEGFARELGQDGDVASKDPLLFVETVLPKLTSEQKSSLKRIYEARGDITSGLGDHRRAALDYSCASKVCGDDDDALSAKRAKSAKVAAGLPKKDAEAAQSQQGTASRVNYQMKEVQAALDRLTETEKARDLAELALHHLADEAARAGKQVGQEVSRHAAIAQHHKQDELKRAKRITDGERMARQAATEEVDLWNEECQRKESAAKRHGSLGKQRLKEKQKAIAEKQGQVEEVRESRFQHDAQKVLQLKGSIDKINRQINGQNEARRKKQHKIQEEHAARKRDLLNEGKNPYEEWRKEDIQADKERQVAELRAKQELRNEKLIKQLIKEDKSYKAKQALLKEKREVQDKFQKEMGNYAREKRVAAYIRKVTIGNVDVLDPTGTAIRIDASKVTVQKTHGFGLGKVRPEEIEKVDRDIRKAKTQMARWRPPRPTDDDDDLALDDEIAAQAALSPMASRQAALTEQARTDGKLVVPKLTVLEQKYLEAARERQKANICSVQRCWGKEFKGDAFIAKPSTITFFDFEVGKKYRQVIEVTNVSLTFNQFKLLPLDDKYKDFFDIIFVPPGRMSAGVTRYITVWFTPKVYEDIDTTFPILAKTGRIDFPLQCKTKKTILTITPQDADANAVIDFGQILSGEQGEQVLQIKNSGALAAGYKLEAVEEGGEFLDMLTWKPARAEFDALATSKIVFTFKPTSLGTFSTILRLSVDNGAQGEARLAKEWRVLVRGSCIDVPIYVEKEEYDMKTCILEHTFRENIVLHNRKSVAMKINVEEPKPIHDELQINPVVAYVQGLKSFSIQVKFSPKTDFLDKNPQYRDKTRPGVQGAFRIRFKVVGADQKLPVYTVLTGILTTNLISFEPGELKFGSCYVGSAATATLTICNESQLPQRYGFVRLPAYIKVDDFPGDVLEEEEADAPLWGCGSAVLDGGGYGPQGIVLPNEKRRVVVTYCPDSATEMDFKLCFKAICGKLCARTFNIHCKGQGRQPPVFFSSSQLQLASIPADATCKDSIEITNKSGVPYSLNLLLPPSEITGLYVNPVCCTIEPDDTKRLQVEFKPNEAYAKLMELPPPPEPEEPVEEEVVPPVPAAKGKAAPGGKAAVPAEPPPEEVEQPPPQPQVTPEEHRFEQLRQIRKHGGRRWNSQSDNGTTIHASWKLPISIRVKPDDVDLQSSMPVVTMYAAVHTCVLPNVLIADPAIADFGEVTALQRSVMPVTLTNMFPGEEQELHIEPLPENACFTVLTAPRTIGTKPFQLMVEFKPEYVQIYQSTLKLYTQNTRVQIPLKGKGVRPVLKINPESGILQLGAVIYGKDCKDQTEQKLEINNDSPFELCYKLETLIAAEPHHVGPPPFTLTPATGIVPGNGSKTVKVTFRPHRPLAVFREKLLVNVPNQKKPTYVYLYGHCFTTQTYCMPYLDYAPIGGSDVMPGSAFLDSVAMGSGAVTDKEGNFAYRTAQQAELKLQFEEGETVKYVLVGACFPQGYPHQPQNSPATTFDFQIQQSEFSSYFTVEAPGAAAAQMAKGPVKPGEAALKVAFRYKPPETSSLSVGEATNRMELELLSGIGKWITCKVKGILIDDPKAPQEISVELKAYLQQI
jgi:hypothetical protein